MGSSMALRRAVSRRMRAIGLLGSSADSWDCWGMGCWGAGGWVVLVLFVMTGWPRWVDESKVLLGDKPDAREG